MCVCSVLDFLSNFLHFVVPLSNRATFRNRFRKVIDLTLHKEAKLCKNLLTFTTTDLIDNEYVKSVTLTKAAFI